MDKKHIKLTSTEITSIWGAYMNDAAINCKFHHFLEKVEDEEVKSLLQKSLDFTKGNLRTLEDIFQKEEYPVPYGFKIEMDVDLSSPKLFSDIYVLHYLHSAAQIALQGYSVNLTLVVRADVYSYFNECISQLTEILRAIKETLLSKGLYNRAPYLPVPDEVDFIKKQSFLTGFFGDKRPLSGPEITNLYANFQRNALGVATMIGFSQVAQSKEVTQFFLRGKELAKKHCQAFGSILAKEDLPEPMTLETEVTDSTSYTYSDKLMMFYVTALIALSIGYYGTAMAMSPRRDIGLKYIQLTQEILAYAEDGANIMIDNGWLEQPPMALNRNKLAKEE